MQPRSPLLLLLIGVLMLVCVSRGSVIGIDLGTDWFKVSIVKRGNVFDLVLNAESKRKTPAMMGIREGERAFGSSAVTMEARFPTDVYGRLKDLVGRKFSDPIAQAYRSKFQNSMVAEVRRGSVAFRHDEPLFPGGFAVFSVEELIAHVLSHAKKQAEVHGEESVDGAVITVPPYFNHHERQAILDAAEIADLKVYNLINDETAVAVKYAIGRSFEKNQYHIFYDMGAGSTVVSLIELSNTNSTKKLPPVPTISVKAFGFDSTLGGNEFDSRLQNWMVDKFVAEKTGKVKGDIRQSQRAMMKMLKKSNELKQMLSANTEMVFSIENVFEEQDFRSKLSRSDFEDLFADLWPRIGKPIDSVLEATGISLADIQSVVLVGGNIRIPKVQEILALKVGIDKIAKNVDQDEAAVMGAGYLAATQSPAFRVKEIAVKDINISPVQVTYETDLTADKKPKALTTTLFAANSALDTRKLMNFKKSTEFSFKLSYSGSKKEFLGVSVSGVSDAIEKYSQLEEHSKLAKDPKVKCMIHLDINSIIKVERCFAEFEIEKTTLGTADAEKESIGSKVLNFFGMGKDKNGDDVNTTETNGTANAENVGSEETKVTVNASAATKNDADTNATANAPTETTVKTVIEKVNLQTQVSDLGAENMNKEEMEAAKKRLEAMDLADRKLVEKDTIRNTLEAFIYKAKAELHALEPFTTPDERETLLKNLGDTGEWLEFEVDVKQTAIDVFKQKFIDLKSMYDRFVRRRVEQEKRPEAIETLRGRLTDARDWANSIIKQTPNDIYHTEEELAGLEKKIVSVETWLEKAIAEQVAKKSYEDPLLVEGDMDRRAAEIETVVKLLKLKKKPKKVVIEPLKEDEDKKEGKKEDPKTPKDGKQSETKVAEDENPVVADEEDPKKKEDTKPTTTPQATAKKDSKEKKKSPKTSDTKADTEKVREPSDEL